MNNNSRAFLLLAVAVPASAGVVPLSRAARSATLAPASALATTLAARTAPHAAAPGPLAAALLGAGPAGALGSVIAPAAADAKISDDAERGLNAAFDGASAPSGMPQDLASAFALARRTAENAGHSSFLNLGAEATLDGPAVKSWNVTLEAKPRGKGMLTRWREIRVGIAEDGASVAETGKRALSRSVVHLPELTVDFKTFVGNSAKFYPDLRFEKATAVRGFAPGYGYWFDPYDSDSWTPITRLVLEARAARAPSIVYRFYPESDSLDGKAYFFTNAFDRGADLASLPNEATVWGALSISAGAKIRASRLAAVLKRFAIDWISPENKPIDGVGEYRLRAPAGQLRRLIEVADSMGVHAGYHYAETEGPTPP